MLPILKINLTKIVLTTMELSNVVLDQSLYIPNLIKQFRKI